MKFEYNLERGGSLMAKVISIYAQKGGVAKSSTTIEVATALTLMGKKVLVIDFDQQCSLTKNSGGSVTGNSICEVLHAECEIKEAIQHLELFDLIAGSERLSKADADFKERDDVFAMLDIIDFIKDDYDYIFIDNTPSRSVLLTMTYVATDYVVIPTEADEGSLDGLVTTIKDINMLVNTRNHESHAKIIGFVLTRAENTALHQVALETLEDLSNNMDTKPFVMKVRKSIKEGEVKSFHTSIFKMYKNTNVAKDYMALAKAIVEKIDEVK